MSEDEKMKVRVTIGWENEDKAAAFLCDQYVMILWNESQAAVTDPRTGIVELQDTVLTRTVCSDQEKITDQMLGAVSVLATQLAQSGDPLGQSMGLMLANLIERGPEKLVELAAQDDQQA